MSLFVTDLIASFLLSILFFSTFPSPLSLLLLPLSLYLQAQYVYIHDALQEYVITDVWYVVTDVHVW